MYAVKYTDIFSVVAVFIALNQAGSERRNDFVTVPKLYWCLISGMVLNENTKDIN